MPRRAPPHSLGDDLLEHFGRPRIIYLAEPEQRLLAELGVRILLGNVEQLVGSRAVTILRQHENQVLAKLPLGERVVERGEIRARGAALAGPKERLLPHLQSFALVPSHVEQPGKALLGSGLRDREQELLLQLVVLELRIE